MNEPLLPNFQTWLRSRLSSGVLFYEPIGAYFYEAAWRRREARLSVD
jgi:hypothetical protein